MKNFVVYAHRSNATGKVFYIGSGSIKRPYSKSGHNPSWGQVAKAGYTVEIIERGLDETTARMIEAQVIRSTSGLVNSIMSTNYAPIDWKKGKKVLRSWAQQGFDFPDSERYFRLLVIFRASTDPTNSHYDAAFTKFLAKFGYTADRDTTSITYGKYSQTRILENEMAVGYANKQGGAK